MADRFTDDPLAAKPHACGFLGKPLEDLRENDLIGLIGARETQVLEFKEIYHHKDPKAKGRDAPGTCRRSPMRMGGVLIMGIAEDDDGVATKRTLSVGVRQRQQ